MLNHSQFDVIYKKFLSGACTGEEIDLLFDYFGVADERDLKHLILRELQSDDDPSGNEQDESERLDLVYRRIKNITHPVSSSVKESAYFLPVLRRLSAAAVLLACLACGFWFYRSGKTGAGEKLVMRTQSADIAAGGNKAVLTLDNGKQIILDHAASGKIASEKGISITKTADGQLIYLANSSGSSPGQQTSYNTIETPNGGQYQVVLPDGTKVWLNAASSLTYPTQFSGNDRVVHLTGEGYFEVAKNPKMPFKVKSHNQEIQVLGTHFNINSYPDEMNIRTTLLEGSVKVLSPQHNQSRVLLPGQQSAINGSGIVVANVDPEESVAWKNGFFQFNQADLESVMRELARWYNVTVRYEGNIKPQRFGGAIQRNLNLSQALEILEKSQVHFRINGKEVIVMP